MGKHISRIELVQIRMVVLTVLAKNKALKSFFKMQGLISQSIGILKKIKIRLQMFLWVLEKRDFGNVLNVSMNGKIESIVSQKENIFVHLVKANKVKSGNYFKFNLKKS